MEDFTATIKSTAKQLKIDNSELTADVLALLHARHAPERNAVYGDGAAGITDRLAGQVITQLEEKPHFKDINRLADSLQSFHRRTLRILREGQVIDQEMVDLLNERYPNHVPLQRLFEETENVTDFLTGRGLDVKGTGLYRAGYSNRKVADLMANILAGFEQAVIRAEKNRVDLSTLQFARENDYMGGLFEEVQPKARGLTFEAIQAAKEDPDFVLSGKDIIKEEIKDPNVLRVMEDGKQVHLKINDPALAQVFRGLNREPVNKGIRFIQTFTRFYSQLATRFNPEFVLSNKIRDLQEAMVYVGSEGASVSRVLGREASGQNMKAVTDHIRGKKTPGAKLYEQMVRDGGTTGGLAGFTRKQVEIDIENIRKLSGSKPRQAAVGIAGSIDKWNQVFEDSTRLSVYRSALDNGFSRDAAARMAKEASVNFNKQGKAGPLINAFYMFSNASIQGSAKMLKSMRNPKVAAAVVSTVTGAVWLASRWNDEIDEDWRNKVSKWDRLNGLNFVLPSSNDKFNYVTIPVSWGLKPVKVAADYATDALSGKETSIAGATGAVLASVIEGYNPIGGTDFISAVTPTVLDLPIDLARNKAWSGSKIRPDWDPYAPGSLRYFRSMKETESGRRFIALADKISNSSGGRIEISPADMEYGFGQLIGGAGRSVSKTINTISAIGPDDEVEVRNIPFASRFYRSKDAEQVRDDKVEQLKKLLTEQSRRRIEARNQAESIYEQMKKMPDAVAAETLKELRKSDKKMGQRVARIKKDDELGLTYPERLLKRLTNPDKAKYIDMMLSEMETDKERNDYLSELTKKGLLTADVQQHLGQIRGTARVGRGNRSRVRRKVLRNRLQQ
jgi:hypothetical protein